MDDGDPVWKTTNETQNCLRGQGNLRYKHDATFTLRDNGCQRLEVDLGFATASDTVKEGGVTIGRGTVGRATTRVAPTIRRRGLVIRV